MTSEEQLIQRYFDAFNRHDLEAVVACFHDHAVLVSSNGRRLVGLAEVRRSYETEFAMFPDAHCQLRVCTGNSGRGVAESFFSGTRAGRGRVEAIGAEESRFARLGGLAGSAARAKKLTKTRRQAIARKAAAARWAKAKPKENRRSMATWVL